MKSWGYGESTCVHDVDVYAALDAGNVAKQCGGSTGAELMPPVLSADRQRVGESHDPVSVR